MRSPTQVIALPQVSSGMLAWSLTFLALLPLTWLLYHGQFNILSFVIVLTPLAAAVMIDKTVGIYLTLIYLFFLGDIRRIVGSLIGFPKMDPLLLVGPVLTIMMVVPLLFRLKLKGGISKTVIALMAIMTLEIVNPRQGPITVGLAGTIYYLVPVSWFWIGRKFGSERMLEVLIYRILLPISVIAALLGLWQTFVGFLPWEQTWIDTLGFGSLYMGAGQIRAIGFSVNSVEYANLELLGCTCSLAAFFSGRRPYILIFPLLATALFLESSRGPIVKLIFAIATAWAMNGKGGRGWAVRLPFALAALVGMLSLGVSHYSSKPISHSTAAGTSADHQLEGLSHPLDSKKSTAGLHGAMVMNGVEEGFRYPIGSGLGSTTLGGKLADRSEEGYSGSSEVDLSDAFISLGLIGGSLYCFFVFQVTATAIRFGKTAPRSIGIPVVAVLAAMLGAWIAPGEYAVAPLMWLIIGCLSSSDSQRRVSKGDAPLLTHAYDPQPVSG